MPGGNAAEPSLLVIADIVPGCRSGGELRLFRMCELLAERWRVLLVAVLAHVDEADGGRRQALRAAGIEVLDLDGPDAAREALVSRVFHAVLLEFWHVAEPVIPAVRRIQPWAVVAVDTVDLHFVRERRALAVGGAEVGGAEAAGVEERARRELATYRAADVRIFTSGAERRLCAEEVGSRPTDLVVPILVTAHRRRERRRPDTVVFVGNFWHAPNVDALEWFVTAVWPIVTADVPTATLVVAGSHVWSKVEELGEAPGVAVRGYVDDLVALYDEASVVVAPIRYGAGVRGKVCEALADAVPVVSTTVGIEGLDLRPGQDLLVGDEAPAFAAAVIHLLTNVEEAAAVGRRGQASIMAQCDSDLARAELGRLAVPLPVTPAPTDLSWSARVAAERARTAASRARRGARRLRRSSGP